MTLGAEKVHESHECFEEQGATAQVGLHSRIAEAAYFLAERRGFAGGDPVEDWLIAERKILGDGHGDPEQA